MEAAKSSYDNRFGGGVSIGRMPVLNTYSGTVRWADSNGGSNGDGSFKRPYASVDAANNVCAAGDLIMVKAGHTETLTTSNTVTQDVAGVAVVGVGVGNRRPTFTFTPSAAADNSWAMSAANCAVVNIIGKPGLDAITNPFNVSAAGCTLDIEWQDASAAIEAETVILTTAAADSLKINLTYRGFTAGNACVAPIKLVGCTDGRINVDFHGVASTAVVNFITTLSTDIFVTGYVFNSGTTDGSKLVVDTIGSSTWYADIQDGAAGSRFTGGSAVAINDVIGTVATAAASGAVTTTDKLMAYVKQVVTELQVVDEFHDVPAANNTLNAQINEVIGNKTDAAAAGAVTATDTLVGYIKQLVTQMGVEADTDPVSAILSGTGGITTWKDGAAPATGISLSEVIRAIYNAVAADGAAGSTVVQPGLGKRVTKVGDISAAPDDLFTVTGKCLITCMVGEVTSVLATTQSLAIVTSTNNQTIAAASTVTSDDVGTLYIVSGDPDLALNGGGTPGLDAATLTNGSLAPFMVNEDKIHQSINGAGTGLIQWDLWYIPLEDSASIASSA